MTSIAPRKHDPMRRRRGPVITTLAAVTIAAVCAGTPAPGADAATTDLFTAGHESRAAAPHLLRARTARLTRALASESGAIDVTLDLFDDVTVATTLVRGPDRDRAVWTGSIAGRPGASVLITVTGGYVFGNVHLGEAGTYTLRAEGDGAFTIGQIDPASIGSESDPLAIPSGTTTRQAIQAAGPRSGTPTIDVMLLWTVQVLNLEFGGDAAAARAWAATRIAELNTVFSASGVDAVARLAYAGTADYDNGGDDEAAIVDDLYNFTFLAGEDCDQAAGMQECDPEGRLDTEHAQRQLVGADIAFLVVEENDEFGIAWGNCGPDTSTAVPNVGSFCDEAYSFGVGEFSVTDSHFTMDHEIGHLLGANHDVANQGAKSTRNYARGYKRYLGFLDPGNFSTVVAYECSPGGLDCSARVGVYSNPNVLWPYDSAPMGEPIGDPATPHEDDGADAATHFGLSTGLIADFWSRETCHGVTPTILGTAGADHIVGTSGDDVILAFAGADVIDSGGGKDRVCGGAGDDEIHGGSAKDRLYGDGGNDTLFGDGKSDRLYGGKDNDILDGGKGSRDRLNGGSGLDDLDGGPGGDDYCTAGEVYSRCENIV